MRLNVVPLAAESFGVRSMATWVEGGGTGMLIDPGAALARSRFGLPPAAEEWEALERARARIALYAARAAAVAVTHYHADHVPLDPAFCRDRLVLAKEVRGVTAGRQAERAAQLWRTAGARRIASADGQRFELGPLEISVSQPLPHGPEASPFGSVVALTVSLVGEPERFCFASDVQGPLSSVATAYLIRERPTLLYVSGPPTYLEAALGQERIDAGIANLRRILDATGCRAIVDHYALRDRRGLERYGDLAADGRVVSAARWLGVVPTPLEAARARLWAEARRPGAEVAASRATMPAARERRGRERRSLA